MTPMTNTVDGLVEKIREQLSSRKRESEERVARIKAAADEYLKATPRATVVLTRMAPCAGR